MISTALVGGPESPSCGLGVPCESSCCPNAAGRYGVAASIAAAIAVAADRDAISESGAGDCALHSFCAAGAVSVARTLRHIERTGGRRHQVALRLAFPFNPLGSPNPPVCTFWTGTFTVGVAELPVENSPV